MIESALVIWDHTEGCLDFFAIPLGRFYQNNQLFERCNSRYVGGDHSPETEQDLNKLNAMLYDPVGEGWVGYYADCRIDAMDFHKFYFRHVFVFGARP